MASATKEICVMADVRLAHGRRVFKGACRRVAGEPGWNCVHHRASHWASTYRNCDVEFFRRYQYIIFEGSNQTLPIIESMRKAGSTVINVSSAIERDELPTPSVISDDEAIGRVAADYLRELNHTAFGYVGARKLPFAPHRIESFSQRLAEAGCNVHAIGRQHGYFGDQSIDTQQAVDELLALPKPIGVMAVTDVRAGLLLHYCQLAGLRVPEDVAILGIDDDDMECETATVPLSSIDPNAQRIGYEAAELLIRSAAGPIDDGVQRVPPLGVIERQSTSLCNVDDADVEQAMQFIQQDAANTTVAEIVEQTAISRRSLEMKFKRIVGRSIGEELQRIRLQQARTMLTTTDPPIALIARRCGFGTSKWLAAQFRSHVGQTPSEYRQIHGRGSTTNA